MSIKGAIRMFTRTRDAVMRAQSMNSEPITILYVTTEPGEGFDPNLETSYPSATRSDLSMVQYAFVHAVNINTSGYVKNQQFRRGDVILDFTGAVDFSGMTNVRFVIDGKIYTQKDAGDAVLDGWDVRCGGVNITKSVLVTLA